jgi:hypothetical protein
MIIENIINQIILQPLIYSQIKMASNFSNKESYKQIFQNLKNTTGLFSFYRGFIPLLFHKNINYFFISRNSEFVSFMNQIVFLTFLTMFTQPLQVIQWYIFKIFIF